MPTYLTTSAFPWWYFPSFNLIDLDLKKNITAPQLM